jgi:SAM-dependent methyltransferase
MGFYRERILPVLVDRACGTAGLRRWRAELSSGLSGRVLEIGFGSGHNVDHYPSSVERVFAVEPSARAFRIAQKRIERSPVPVELVGLDGQSIPLPEDSCDDALCTFALCTIPDVDAALAEVRRVLRPGGRFHFLEHGLAPDPGVAAWQHRLEPSNAGWPTAAISPGTPSLWSVVPASSSTTLPSATGSARSPGVGSPGGWRSIPHSTD